MKIWPIAMLVSLAGCAAAPTVPLAQVAAIAPIEVQILAINDFHGNLEPPKVWIEAGTKEAPIRVPAGGIAHLATAVKTLRGGHPHSVTVAAGDLIGGSPLVSALFLDEPTVRAMDLLGLEYNAVGNHEFDKGTAELERMQRGGCEKYTTRTPCRVEPFAGARFKFLAANVIKADGSTLFPGTAIRDFGPAQVGFIGMTLKETASIVTPAGVAGVTFADEAATANATVPALKAAGADAIVLLIHQGGRTKGGYNDKSCPELTGDILPILERLDPAIDLVVSGHTHAAYICEKPRAGGRPLLLTSAGQYGTLISDIRLTVDPARGVTARRADNIIVQNEGYRQGEATVLPVSATARYAADPAAAALLDRYVAASRPEARRIVGKLPAAVTRQPTKARENSAGAFIADAQLAATRDEGSQIAFINSGGVRADLVPAADGSVTFGDIFAMQPFGNNLVVKTFTGAQLRALLEQPFAGVTSAAGRKTILMPSKGFAYSYDLSRPDGHKIVAATLDGKPIDPEARYRITVNNFLASGGDNLTVLTQGVDTVDAGLDLDAVEAYLRAGASVPVADRIKDLTPPLAPAS